MLIQPYTCIQIASHLNFDRHNSLFVFSLISNINIGHLRRRSFSILIHCVVVFDADFHQYNEKLFII